MNLDRQPFRDPRVSLCFSSLVAHKSVSQSQPGRTAFKVLSQDLTLKIFRIHFELGILDDDLEIMDIHRTTRMIVFS